MGRKNVNLGCSDATLSATLLKTLYSQLFFLTWHGTFKCHCENTMASVSHTKYTCNMQNAYAASETKAATLVSAVSGLLCMDEIK